jgi:hypothetical protein
MKMSEEEEEQLMGVVGGGFGPGSARNLRVKSRSFHFHEMEHGGCLSSKQ